MDRYLSIINSYPVSYSVYSSLSFFGPDQGGELPGRWFVSALGRVGHDAAAVRQTLWRMERSGELEGRAEGRQRFYRFTPLARAEARIGLARIMDDPRQGWDGRWTVVHLRFGRGRRTERERAVAALHAAGFRSAMPGVFLHPRDRSADLDQVVAALSPGRITVFLGRRCGGPSNAVFVRTLWDLDALARRYRAFVEAWKVDVKKSRWSDADAFAGRFALVFSYLDIAWNDPELPAALLPAGWPGVRARSVARTLYRRLQPGALALSQGLLAPASNGVPA